MIFDGSMAKVSRLNILITDALQFPWQSYRQANHKHSRSDAVPSQFSDHPAHDAMAKLSSLGKGQAFIT